MTSSFLRLRGNAGEGREAVGDFRELLDRASSATMMKGAVVTVSGPAFCCFEYGVEKEIDGIVEAVLQERGKLLSGSESPKGLSFK